MKEQAISGLLMVIGILFFTVFVFKMESYTDKIGGCMTGLFAGAAGIFIVGAVVFFGNNKRGD